MESMATGSMAWAINGRVPAHSSRVSCCAARKICEALGNSQEEFQKLGITVIGGFCLGRGIVPGDAVRHIPVLIRHEYARALSDLTVSQLGQVFWWTKEKSGPSPIPGEMGSLVQ
jgi:hypothetical protein